MNSFHYDTFFQSCFALILKNFFRTWSKLAGKAALKVFLPEMYLTLYVDFETLLLLVERGNDVGKILMVNVDSL